MAPCLDHQAGDRLARLAGSVGLRRRARLPHHERHQRRRENEKHPGVAVLPPKFSVTHALRPLTDTSSLPLKKFTTKQIFLLRSEK
jgi:hypothetical protein